MESVPDIGMVDGRYPLGHSKRERAGQPLRVKQSSRAAVRGCPTCHGRGSIPRDSLLDPMDQKPSSPMDSQLAIVLKEIDRLSSRRQKNYRDGIPTGKLDQRLAELFEMKRALLARKAGEKAA